jgi:hypothetical protein
MKLKLTKEFLFNSLKIQSLKISKQFNFFLTIFILFFSDQSNKPFDVLIQHINKCSTREFLYSFIFSKDETWKNCICINSLHCLGMKKPALEVIFYGDFIMTQNEGLPKKTFLHPDSDKDYYKRSSKKDLLGKSRKNLSFVVPVQKLDERLKDV